MTELSDLLGYQLHLTNLIVQRDTRTALAAQEVTPAKVTAMLFVRDNPGCDQSTLGRLLSINRSSAMKLVNILCDRGFVRRRQGRDLRSNGLHLTERGAAFLREMVAILQQTDRALTAELSEPERVELLRLLAKVRAGAEAAAPLTTTDAHDLLAEGCEQRKVS